MGRLGVAYNSTSKKYVLLSQHNGASGNGELFATSTTPNGKFVFDHIQTTLPNVTNGMSGDQTVFVDDDGKEHSISAASAIANWTKLSLAGIPIADGKVGVGVRADANAGNWARIDDIELVKEVGTSVGVVPSKRRTPDRLIGAWEAIPLEKGRSLQVLDPEGRILGAVLGDGTKRSLRELGYSEGVYLLR